MRMTVPRFFVCGLNYNYYPIVGDTDFTDWHGLNLCKSVQSVSKSLPKFSTRLGCIRCIEDGRHHADSFRPRFQHRVNRLQIDSADGEPRHSHICRSPTDVFERDRLGGRLRARSVDWPDGDVICATPERGPFFKPFMSFALTGSAVSATFLIALCGATENCVCSVPLKNHSSRGASSACADLRAREEKSTLCRIKPAGGSGARLGTEPCGLACR